MADQLITGTTLIEDKRKGVVNITSRGDATAYDFSVGDLTTNGTKQELDLSALVPTEAAFVYLRCRIKDGSIDQGMEFYSNIFTGNYSQFRVITQVANQAIEGNGWVPLDGNRKIAYTGANTAFTEISLVVVAWV